MKTLKLSPSVRPSPSLQHARRWRPPVINRAAHPARIERIDGGLVVVGVAAIASAPHRSSFEAMELAERVAQAPLEYLPLMLRLGLVGVTDLRRQSLRVAV